MAGRGYDLRLPEVKHEIKAVRKGGKPTYIYEDVQFKLDHDEIMNLLMGESLYGDPGLCIRELLQNALDALEMRDLRLQAKKSGETPREPVDGVLLRPGFFDVGHGEQELKVQLTWGGDDEQGYWIKVEDNGIGMTKQVICSFFTQIGKSYYRSSRF